MSRVVGVGIVSGLWKYYTTDMGKTPSGRLDFGWSSAIVLVIMKAHIPHKSDPLMLTLRETDVLNRLAEGDTNDAIAAALHLSVKTVKEHINNLFIKSGADNRTQLVSMAFRAGLVS
jgi:DNA-binding NarL/FixJ family response regulator